MVTHADVRNEVTAPTLNEINYELNRLATTAPSDEELSKAKRYLVGSEAISVAGPNGLIGAVGGPLGGRPATGTNRYLRAKSCEHHDLRSGSGCQEIFPSFPDDNRRGGLKRKSSELRWPLGIPVKTLQ